MTVVPHVDVMRTGSDGWLAVMHRVINPGQKIGPRVVHGHSTEQLTRRIAAVMISEYGVSQECANHSVTDSSVVRNVENTIMAAYAKGKGDS